jgi:thioesterase domain-containing protein
VAGLASAVERAATGQRMDELLVPLQAGGGKRPLFLVHPVFGDVSLYRHLAEGLGPERPVYGVQPVGLTTDEPPLATVEEMAERYLAAVRSAQPRGPYLLAGSSMGGAVAYEMATRLTARGERVAFLGLLDTWAGDDPALQKVRDPGIESVLMAYLAGGDDGVNGDGARRLDRLAPEARADLLLERARSAGTLTAAFGRDDLARLIVVAETGRRAARAYRPGSYPGLLTFFRASGNGLTARPERRWQELAGGGVTVHSVAGSHVSMLIPPHVAELAQRMQHHLERVGEPA